MASQTNKQIVQRSLCSTFFLKLALLNKYHTLEFMSLHSPSVNTQRGESAMFELLLRLVIGITDVVFWRFLQ